MNESTKDQFVLDPGAAALASLEMTYILMAGIISTRLLSPAEILALAEQAAKNLEGLSTENLPAETLAEAARIVRAAFMTPNYLTIAVRTPEAAAEARKISDALSGVGIARN